MKFKFNVARRLIFGFGILTIAMLANSIMMYMTLNKNRAISDNIRNVYVPTVSHLNDLYVKINNSKMLIKNWVFIERQEDTPDKLRLKALHSATYPATKDKLMELSGMWEEKNRQLFQKICTSIEDTLFQKHKFIMTRLNSFDSYSDAMVIFDINPMVEENGEVILITDRILNDMETLLQSFQEKTAHSNATMSQSFDDFQRYIILLGIILFLGAIVIALFTIRSIIKPIGKLKSVLTLMTKGVLPDRKLKVTNDEIGDMVSALNTFISGLRKTSEFSMEIGRGNFDSDFTPLSEDDTLGNSLLDMRKNLQQAAENEKIRKKEDEERNWITQGLAKFGDILRQNNDNMEELSYSIISNMVKYMSANQGGMFIINDDDKDDVVLEMTAAYAYDRRKFADKTIHEGEGLVGTCYLEKKTIYMTDVPDSYLNITSGLGKANPRCILIVPLKVNEEIFGVIEIASFNKFEKYHVEFVEKVAESIASTISTVKINTRTAQLLEESKQQSRQLIQQEEEMRQNLEELQATQEESARKISELEKSLDVVHETVATFEMDMEGNILNANGLYAEMLNLDTDQLPGKNHQMLLDSEKLNVESYMSMLTDFRTGIHHQAERIYNTSKGNVTLLESYTPVKNDRGGIEHIFVAAIDTTKMKK